MILFSNLKFTTVAEAKRITGLSYVGGVSHSAKLRKTETNKGELTYGIYLAPANCSGFNVCEGASKYCKDACLNMSGRNGMDKTNAMQSTRIKKTVLMLTNSTFMFDWITVEINRYIGYAQKNNFTFSVRINCTSDIDISKFKNSNGLNMLEQFPDIQFYDYTKLICRIELMKQYLNYDLTYSFNGVNYASCKKALKENVRVAIVFEKVLPGSFDGYTVVNGDKYDIRYIDPKDAIVGLVFKRVRNKINIDETPFIISLGDKRRSD